MKQRAVLMALLLVCLMTVVGLVEVRGGKIQRTNQTSHRRKCWSRELPTGCFDIKVNPKTARQTFLVNKCTGDTWNGGLETGLKVL